MTPNQYKALVNRLRDSAERQGLRLHKHRARDPRSRNYGTFKLVDSDTGAVVAGHKLRYGLTIADVAAHLYGPRP